MTTFAALVDKLIEASSYANLVHVIAPNDEGGPRELAAARQAIFTAFDVAVRTADADGYARALAEVDAACVRLSDHDEFGHVTIMRVGPDYAPYPWTAESTPKTGVTLAADEATPTAAILAAAAELIDTSSWAEADPPALVNGGPARDALDDGR